jgi:hypothetical protein
MAISAQARTRLEQVAGSSLSIFRTVADAARAARRPIIEPSFIPTWTHAEARANAAAPSVGARRGERFANAVIVMARSEET